MDMEVVKDVRNPANNLVCRVHEVTGDVEIKLKDWVTIIKCKCGIGLEISHLPKDAL